MISREKFIEIVNRLRNTDDTVNKVNEILRNTLDSQLYDYLISTMERID